ncbi:MAG TPA: hypothetical protein VFB45_13580 [Pseudolabrys sp.]|nr:hypothetical protein [Pseudolabrys sp.]
MATAVSEAVPTLDFLAAQAERAGFALACPFSSSDEFDAAVIRARRAAGAYGHKRHRRSALFVVALALAGLVILFAI